MVLRIHSEHTTRADHHMVDIRTTLADANGMEHPPLRAEPAELLGDGLLTVRADPLCPLVRLRVDHPGEQVPHQPLRLALRQRPLTRCSPGSHVREIVPSGWHGRLG